MVMPHGVVSPSDPKPQRPAIAMLAFGMPRGFTHDDVAALAALASLELDRAEVDLFARQLGDILAYASEVQQIDTSGVAPTAYVLKPGGAERPDEIRPSLDRDEALAGAPDAPPRAGLFRVPRVIG
jgi:aspartyl-tRNA(Asn)/glutamyl-tRNA(Gln) amidotransferase subunit C